MNHPFKGVITALVTPFKDDELDLSSLANLLEHQIQGGIKCIVLGGSTGEGVALDFEECLSLIRESIKLSNGRLKIVAGCSASSTKLAIAMLIEAEKLGVDALMCTTPPYNKPNQDGLYEHFKAVHDATNLPIALYANPARAVIDFTEETIIKLAQLPRIVALKDCDDQRTLSLSNKIDNFALMSGDDIAALTNRLYGGVGVVSVISNIFPREILTIQEAWDKGDIIRAKQLFQDMVPRINAMFVEVNPAPVKYAASLMGLCQEDMRLPLCGLKDENKKIIRSIMQ